MTTTTDEKALPVSDDIKDIPKGSLTEKGEYESATGPIKFFDYEGGPLVDTEEWKLYVAELQEPKGQLGLLMIANTEKDNDVVQLQGTILGSMQELSGQLDNEAELPEFAPNYGAFFPRLVEQIDADGRVALILGYHPTISDYRALKPLTFIQEDKRVDLKSVMWILGKSLKLATLFHEAGYTIGKVSPDNVFITMDNLSVHGVFYFDFTYSEAGDSAIRAELSEMAKMAWDAAGGTDTTEPPHDSDIMNTDQHREFVNNLKRMIDGEVTDARTEMDRLYEINDRIWPKVPIVDGPNSRGQTHKRQWHEFKLRNR